MTLTRYVDGQGAAVSLDRELGRGGQGAVYLVTGRPQIVAKVYLELPDHQTSRKLEALARASDPQLLSVSAWPQSVIKDASGKLRGFVMPLVNEADFKELHMLYRVASRRQAFPGVDWRFLVHVARNVTRGFVVLHKHGHLMGDVSSRNVMVSKQGMVRFIDTDSFQIRVDGETYSCPVGTAEFTPPELQGKGFGSLLRTPEHDLFGLALLIFHLLFDGRHPYAGIHDNGAMPSPAEAIKADQFAYSLRQGRGVRPPPFTLTLDGLHKGLQDLFERAFSPQHQHRPSATEWETTLAELSEQLTVCGKNSTHWHDRRLPCPWCALLPGSVQAATAKTGIPAGAKRLDVEAELNRIWKGVQAIPVPPAPAPITVQAVPAPLALPARPQLTLTAVKPSVPAILWGSIFALIALWAVSRGIWLLFFILVGLSWYQFSRNSAAKLKNLQETQQLQAQEVNKQQYQALLQKDLKMHEREADILRRRISEAYGRQQSASAQAQYRTTVTKLEELRREVRNFNQEEQDQLSKLLERHRKPLLEQYLALHTIRPGLITGVGPSLIANLNQHGIHTAKDVTPNVRWIKGVGPKRQQDLLDWRDTLEQFFQFDPARIPAQEFDTIRNQMDQKRQTKLAALENGVSQFQRDIPGWQAREQAIATDIAELKFKLAERERTIDIIQQGQNLLQ